MQSRLNFSSGLIILISYTLLLHSCVPAYIPNHINTPLISEKGDMEVSCNAGSNDLDVQFSYAPTNQIATIVNSSFTLFSNLNRNQHYFAEGGIGYYKTLNNDFIMESYLGSGYGIGQGYFEGLPDAYESPINGNIQFHREFLITTIAKKDKWGSIAFSNRIVYFDPIEYNYTEFYYDSIVYSFKGNANGEFYTEPVLSFKIGSKRLHINIQTGVSIRLTKSNANLNYRPFMFSLGLSYNINAKEINLKNNLKKLLK
jgi:hypothetical protein